MFQGTADHGVWKRRTDMFILPQDRFLIRRIYEPNTTFSRVLLKKYNVTRLVWYEQGEDITQES